jgi:hypothetical protein
VGIVLKIDLFMSKIVLPKYEEQRPGNQGTLVRVYRRILTRHRWIEQTLFAASPSQKIL